MPRFSGSRTSPRRGRKATSESGSRGTSRPTGRGPVSRSSTRRAASSSGWRGSSGSTWRDGRPRRPTSSRPPARGRGVAVRALRLVTAWAFEERGMERVELRITSYNLPSLKVADRAGFVREGVLRSVHFKEGKRVDIAVYSRLASDPLATSPSRRAGPGRSSAGRRRRRRAGWRATRTRRARSARCWR